MTRKSVIKRDLCFNRKDERILPEPHYLYVCIFIYYIFILLFIYLFIYITTLFQVQLELNGIRMGCSRQGEGRVEGGGVVLIHFELEKGENISPRQRRVGGRVTPRAGG